MPSRVTIRDVARMAGVHPATVSRALNESTRHIVNAQTVVRVMDAARQLAYEPDLMARTLRTGRTSTVGVLIPDLTNPVFPPIIRGIQDLMGENDYTTLIGNTDNEPAVERRVFRALRSRQVDGFILLTAARNNQTLKALIEDQVPVVTVNRPAGGGAAPSVSGDDAAGITAVVDHLVGLGHRRFGSITGPHSFTTGRVRQRAVERALARHGLQLDSSDVCESDAYSVAEGERCADLLVADGKRTALVAANDLLALGALAALARRGLRCPEDVSVTGFNDMSFADMFDPPLTTVRLPHREMGLVAAQLMLNLLGGVPVATRHVVLPVELVVRGSTAIARG